MKIPFREYTFANFIEYMLTLKFETANGLKICCFLTDYADWKKGRQINLEQVFNQQGKLEQMGEIYRFSAYYRDTVLRRRNIANFYLFLERDTQLLFCFTDEKIEAVEKIMGDIAETTSGIYYMFVSPNVFLELKNNIKENYPDSFCNHFNAKHFAKFAKKGEIRPNVDRTIIYYGNDALDSLEEFTDFYGVSPRIMVYNIPDLGTFEIKNTGCFTLTSPVNVVESVRYLLNLVEITSVNVLRARKIVESSDFVLIPFRTEKKVFEIPKLIPWRIKFDNKIGFRDTNLLVERLNENGYSLLNSILVEGSVRLNGLVIDEKKLKIFTIDFNGEEMVIAPREKITFDVFLRFYTTILENFDPQAKMEEFA